MKFTQALVCLLTQQGHLRQKPESLQVCARTLYRWRKGLSAPPLHRVESALTITGGSLVLDRGQWSVAPAPESGEFLTQAQMVGRLGDTWPLFDAAEALGLSPGTTAHILAGSKPVTVRNLEVLVGHRFRLQLSPSGWSLSATAPAGCREEERWNE